MSNFKFGQIVKVSGYIKRHRAGARRWWQRFPIKEYEAIFLGDRKLSDGKVEWKNHGEEGIDSYFDPEQYHPGALVCQKGRNPVKVFLSDICV